jgi:hypothetical protein
MRPVCPLITIVREKIPVTSKVLRIIKLLGHALVHASTPRVTDNAVLGHELVLCRIAAPTKALRFLPWHINALIPVVDKRRKGTLYWSCTLVDDKASGIARVHRIIAGVHVEVRLPATEPDRILANPPSDDRIIIPCAKSDLGHDSTAAMSISQVHSWISRFVTLRSDWVRDQKSQTRVLVCAAARWEAVREVSTATETRARAQRGVAADAFSELAHAKA